MFTASYISAYRKQSKRCEDRLHVVGTARYAFCCLLLRFLQLLPDLVLFVTNIAQVTLKKG